MNRIAVALSSLFLAAASPAARAQPAYPSRPVALLVPAPPGGGTDIFARQLGEIVSETMGQKFVVENRPGGGGTLGTTQIVAAQPDGHTLGFIWSSPLTTSPHSLTLAYTPDSYRPIMSIGYSSYVLCVRPDFPAATGAEFIAALKAAPGRYTYGNDGVGGTMQLAAERIFRKIDTKVRAVPFGGAAETARNFLGGHVDIYGGSIPPILPHVQAGTAKCLLLTSASGNAALPRAAGLGEVGLAAEETVLWWGLIVPAKTPPAIMLRLQREFTAAAQSDRFKAVMASQGATPLVMGSTDTDRLLRGELEALGQVAQAIGIQKRAQ